MHTLIIASLKHSFEIQTFIHEEGIDDLIRKAVLAAKKDYTVAGIYHYMPDDSLVWYHRDKRTSSLPQLMDWTEYSEETLATEDSIKKFLEIDKKEIMPFSPVRFEAGRSYVLPWTFGTFLNVEILGRGDKYIWVRDVEGKLVRREIEVTKDGIETAKPFGDFTAIHHSEDEEVPPIIRADALGKRSAT